MARPLRVDIGDLVYHVINRSNGRLTIFENKEQYQDFEYLLTEMKELYDMQILAYVIMPNHWHLLLQPKNDGDLSMSMSWLGTTHTRRYHCQTGTIGGGHLYQGRYKSFLVQDDTHLLTVLKYIERNPVRAKIKKHPEDWLWGSAYRRIKGTKKEQKLLAESPTPLPRNYRQWITYAEPTEELATVRQSIVKGVPYGGESWTERMIKTYKLESTMRSPGRPKNN
ncbi:MAG: transposase [bacterium]|nr:transposase [bacterium]